MEIQKKITTIRNSWKKNPSSTVDVRIDKLKKLLSSIQQHHAMIKEALFLDLGKCSFESYVAEIGYILDEIKKTIKDLPEWMQATKVSTPIPIQPAKSFIYPSPYGLVLIMSPWNYPFQLAFSPLIGAIAAGNRVVLKPSEISSHTANIIEKICRETFNEDEVLVVQGGVEETQELLKQKFDQIFFTGSTQVGRVVMRAAAENLTPVVLELGGKSPCIVGADASLKYAAKRIVWGKFMNAGQTCVAPDYLIVHEKVMSKFLDELVSAIKAFYGENAKTSPDYGRIISDKHFQRLVKLMSGGKIYFGGKTDPANRFIEPTLLIDVNLSSPLMEEEIFGPILPIMSYSNLDQAIEFIQDRPRPLAAYLFSDNKQDQESWLEKVSCGGGCINDTLLHLANPELPFGGIGESGMGAYHGKKTFDIFSHQKSILKQTNLIDVPLRYPPYNKREELVKYLIG